MSYESIVGKRWSYYRPRFEKFARGEWLSWNWAAFFGTLAWLRYRKLYAWSWAYLLIAVPVLVTLLYLWVTRGSCEQALAPGYHDVYLAMALGLFALGWVIPPIIANRVYYHRVRTEAAKTENAVTGAGGVAGALFLQTVIVLGAIVTLPGFTMFDYRYRSFASEGIALASGAKTPVTEYYLEHKRFPARLAEVKADATGRYVARVVIEPDGTIRSIFGERAMKIAGRSVMLMPVRKDDLVAEWTCRSRDIPDQCLPAVCRGGVK